MWIDALGNTKENELCTLNQLIYSHTIGYTINIQLSMNKYAAIKSFTSLPVTGGPLSVSPFLFPNHRVRNALEHHRDVSVQGCQEGIAQAGDAKQGGEMGAGGQVGALCIQLNRSFLRYLLMVDHFSVLYCMH